MHYISLDNSSILFCGGIEEFDVPVSIYVSGVVITRIILYLATQFDADKIEAFHRNLSLPFSSFSLQTYFRLYDCIDFRLPNDVINETDKANHSLRR